MSINLNQNLTIEQRQELKLTPEMILSIKILKYNVLELDNYLKEQLKENPVLEQESPNWELQLKDSRREDFGAGNYSKKSQSDEYFSFENYVSAGESLEEHLLMQLEVSTKSEDIIRMGTYLIESLDENGYLMTTLKDAATALNTDAEHVKKVLSLIHTFEPYGVGARNLAECMAIQLQAAGLWNQQYLDLLKNHMDDFMANKLNKISRAMNIPVDEVQDMADILRHLDPKPGKQYSNDYDKQYIVPEIMVEEVDGEYIAVFRDDSVPRLMVSSYYQSVLTEHREDPEVLKYIKSRIEAAGRLISNIEKRKQTIRKVAQAIVSYQQDFFRKGDKYLKPMTLKLIAEKIEMHESTVSRAVTGKYLQCRSGVFELKYFFSSGLKSTGADKELSSNSIKAYIRDIIHKEDPKNPVSDQKVTDLLNDRGISIARRTVAKYRESMNIPTAAMRKRY